MSLKETWKNKTDGVDDVLADDINDIAQAVIELEANGAGGDGIIIDTEMSDTSENAVQNKVIKAYVDGTKNDLEAYIDETILGGAW